MAKLKKSHGSAEPVHVFSVYVAEQVLSQRPDMAMMAILDVKRKSIESVLAVAQLAREQGVSVEWASREQLDKMAPGERHQGVVLKCCSKPWWCEAEIDALLNLKTKPFVLILDGVQDPHNLGAILRSAHMMGVDMVIAPKRGACGLSPAVHKVSCGGSVLTPYIQVTNLARVLQQLAERGIWITALDAKASSPLSAIDLKGSLALVMGSEGRGARQLSLKCCDFYAHIPMQGALDSLNVSVAAGIAMYEVQRQRLLAT